MTAKKKATYWQEMYLGDDRSRYACRSWFAPLADDVTPYKAEILCEVETDEEKKIRAFMRDAEGNEYKFERTKGPRYNVSRKLIKKFQP